jgi:hypothetical protein
MPLTPSERKEFDRLAKLKAKNLTPDKLRRLRELIRRLHA